MVRSGRRECWRVRIRCLAGLAVVVVWGALSSPALCAENDKAVARAHYETATRLYDLREYSKALDEYKAAYLAKPDPAFLFNIGQCYRRLGETSSALDFYRQYLKKTPADDPNRAQADARIHDIEAGRESDDDPFAKPDGKTTRLPEPQRIPATPPEPPPPPEAVPAPVPILLPAEQATVPQAAAVQPAGLDLSASPPRNDLASPPVYRTWWFWTGVGAVVVAGAVSAILISRGGSEANTASTTLGTQAVFQ